MKRILKHKISGLPAQVAWAENERGFDVLQMQLSSVVLPSIPGATVRRSAPRGSEGWQLCRGPEHCRSSEGRFVIVDVRLCF